LTKHEEVKFLYLTKKMRVLTKNKLIYFNCKSSESIKEIYKIRVQFNLRRI